MTPVLDITEIRVLGALIEKDATTPAYYPLSLNALIDACNQKSNRDPVMDLDEDAVRHALDTLREKGMAGPVSSADSRVPKYEHRLQEMLNLTRGETALLCVLLLRGPQTPGELRGRSERMFRFDALSDVESTLERLMRRDHPLVTALPRQPGTKELRYAHLLGADLNAAGPSAGATTATGAASTVARLSHLENEIAELRTRLAELTQHFDAFRKKFEQL